MRSLLQDLRYAGRLLVRSPGFTLLTVLTLALGIGANAAIFSVVDGVLLTPLPYRQPGGLMAIYSQFPGLGFDKFWVSGPEYMEFRRWNQSFQNVGSYVTGEVNVEGKEQPLRVRAAAVTASLLSTLGVDPVVGRVFTEADDLPELARRAGRPSLSEPGHARLAAFGEEEDSVLLGAEQGVVEARAQLGGEAGAGRPVEQV